MHVTIRRTIAAPPEHVFAVYTDAARLSQWQPGVRGIVEATGPLSEAGTSYVIDQAGPRLRIEVLDVDTPDLHRQLEAYRWYSWVGTARFDRLGAGSTLFSYQYAPRLRDIGWLLAPAMMAIALVYMRSEFDRLKGAVENEGERDRTG